MEHSNEVTITGEVYMMPTVATVGKEGEYEKCDIILEIKRKGRRSSRRSSKPNLAVIEFSGDLAYDVADELDAGDVVTVEGYVNSREWEDKEGVTRYFTSVRGRDWQVHSKGSGEPATQEHDDVSF